ncbi:endo-1,4-beta-xylanase [Cellulomonas edaphi]|uniref:Beta-xylanase n=1 Tax=Cellulomonas edaphi TaxID=3053468 RepID=A0ABT7S3Z2_9CELL|nr:endo-1,4-beta-xylanase [Cellulomons edaphi]MDM7830333.1 endo-1,4-beta-xylanase [Cellulomons edaphi]
MRPVRTLRRIGTAIVAVAVAAVTAGVTTGPAVAADDGPATLIANDFESGGATPWGPRGPVSLTVVDTAAHSGSRSLAVTGRTGDWNGPATDVSSLFPAGSAVTVSAWVRLAPGTTGSSAMHFTVEQSPADNQFAWVGSPVTVTADGWAQLTGTYTRAASVTSASLYLEAAPIDGANPSFLVDDVLVTTPGGGADPDPDVVPGGAVNPVPTPVSAARGTGDVAALTFDDGPNGATTGALLDFLAEQGIHATFCVIGQNIQAPGGAEMLRRIVAEGHTLCNHTTSYADMGSWSAAQVRADLVENLAIIRDALGDPQAKVPYFRAPNGSWGQTAQVAVDLGMQPLAVTNTISDWETQDVSTLTTNLRAAMKPGQVVLAHDGGGDRSGTLAAVRTVVAERLAAGWSFTLPAGGADGDGTVPTALSTGFEDGLGVWSARGNGTAPVVAVSDVAHGGAHSASVTGRTDGWHGLGASVTDAFVSGRTYAISAWVRLAADETAPADVRVSVQRDNGGTSSYDTVTTAEDVTADAWTRLTGSYTMTSADTALLYFETASGTASFLVDDIVVTGSTAPPVQQDIPSLKDELPWPVGVAIDERETAGPGKELVTKHFDQLTPENVMKPEAIQPTEGTFTFEAADQLVDFAIANGLRVYGHTLVWHSQTPAWFFQHEDGTPLADSADDKALLLGRMTTHIETVANHFRTKYGEYGTAGNPIVGFDVVNEAIAESESDGLRRSEWYRTLGSGYIKDAFEIASQAFNDGDVDGPVKLFINDYNTELPAKRQAMFDVVDGLLTSGTPINGVGHQFHVSLAQPVDQMRTSLEKFATLGVLQDVSELDVQIDGTVTQEKLVAQGYYFASVFSMLREFPDLFSVTVWGPYDSRSWRTGAPLVFDDELQAKPAYWGIVDPSKLPTLTRAANAQQTSPDDSWALLPDVEISGGTGFQLRWSGSQLTARVHVVDATDDGADDSVTLFGPGEPVVVTRSEATSTSTGYDVVVDVPLTAPGAVGATVPFDVRVADGSGSTASWNDLSNHQETGGALGVVTLIGPIGVVDVPRTAAAPTIDGVVDAAWADAPSVRTDVQVEGTGGASANVRLLWHGDSIDVLAEVTDPHLDATSSNAWEQDSVEIFLDPVNAKAGAYNPADGQYRISYTGAESVSGDLSVIGDRLTSATRVVDGGYVVEASLSLGHAVTAGDLAGLDFQVNDATAGVRDAVRTWSDPTGRSYQDTSRWGVGRFVEPAGPQPAAPAVTRQPASVTGTLGSTVKLTAAASGVPAPTVRWQRLGSTWVDVPGATSPSLAVTLSASTDGSRYRAVFTNASGVATTATAAVKVKVQAPKVTTQPRSTQARTGRSVTLKAAASGYPAPTVRWQKRAAGSTTWRAVSGATRPSLTVTVGATRVAYRAVFTNRGGQAVTRTATVYPTPVTPRITSQPRSVRVASGTTVRFSVTVSGTPAPLLQWYQRAPGSSSWYRVTGATGRTLVVKAGARTDGTSYRVVVRNRAGSVTSHTAVLQVRHR